MKKQYKMFMVHKKYIATFKSLQKEYKNNHPIFKHISFTNNMAFIFMVEYVKEMFQKEKIYLKAPDKYIKNIRLLGRRKNYRVEMKKEDKKSINIPLPEEILITYINLIYSWNKNNAEKYISTTSFFYKFIDLIEANKNEFLKFKN